MKVLFLLKVLLQREKQVKNEMLRNERKLNEEKTRRKDERMKKNEVKMIRKNKELVGHSRAVGNLIKIPILTL